MMCHIEGCTQPRSCEAIIICDCDNNYEKLLEIAKNMAEHLKRKETEGRYICTVCFLASYDYEQEEHHEEFCSVGELRKLEKIRNG